MRKNIKNPNTSRLWNDRLFDENQILLRSPIYIDKIKRVLRFLKVGKGKFLDIGLGLGNLEKLLIESNLNIKLFGIDISTKAVLNAKKKFGRNFYVANIFHLPFNKSVFDSVAILDVLEHIYEDETSKALKEVYRVMKKGGVVVISVPLNENLEELNKNGKNYNRHLQEYTFKNLSKKLVSSGFVVLKSDYLYAFNKFYWSKSLIVKLVPGLRKPNLLIVYCKKK